VLKEENRQLREKRTDADAQFQCDELQTQLEQLKLQHAEQLQQLKERVYQSEMSMLNQHTLTQTSVEGYQAARQKVYREIQERLLPYLHDNFTQHLHTFLKETGLQTAKLADPVELCLSLLKRLKNDNNWLVDKLAEVEQAKLVQ